MAHKGKWPLDTLVLRNIVDHYEGETQHVPECELPVYHGYGEATFKTGFKYKGHFAYGRMHGQARIEWENGVVYEGDLTHNEITGHGKYTWPNGGTYVGQVVNAKRHGNGVFVTGDAPPTTPKQQENIGEHEDQPPLFSEEKSTNASTHSNSRFEGQWFEGLPHGYGELVYDELRNIRYEGNFVHGKREGKGRMRYANGNIYDGEWKEDVKCGVGSMMWQETLESYEGEWKDDHQHGIGIHIWKTAVAQKERNWYEGNFLNGFRDGYGIFYYANGSRYEGEWKENVKEGNGIFFYEDGRVFVGKFSNDRAIEEVGISSSEEDKKKNISKEDGQIDVRMILYVDDLLSHDQNKRQKALKAIENAALRLNSELRTIYRHYAKETLTDGLVVPMERSGSVLMEMRELRRFAAECSLGVTSGVLDALLDDVRKAQREHVQGLCKRKQQPFFDAPVHTIGGSERLLLYREFVEVLVRGAYLNKVSNGETSKCFSLSDAFNDLYDQVIKDHVCILDETSMKYEVQLYGKELQNVFKKHHDLLTRLYQEQIESIQDENPTQKRLKVRTFLSLLQQHQILTKEFRVRDVLGAIERFMATNPIEACYNDEPDPSIVEIEFNYSEFLEALAAVAYAKHSSTSTESGPVPLYVLASQLLENFI
jgi:hypothetical protein